MIAFKQTYLYGIGMHLLSGAFVSALLWWLSKFVNYSLGEINFNLFYQAAITFTTGAMIAILLAVFYSDNVRIRVAREHRAAFTFFAVIIAEMVTMVFSGLFIDRSPTNVLALILVCVCMVDMSYLVLRLAYLALSKEN